MVLNPGSSSRPQTRCASPSTATATQAPTGKDRCLASPHDRLDPNQSLPTQTQKAALPTQFSEEPDDGLVHCRTEQEANALRVELRARLEECGLQMHPT